MSFLRHSLHEAIEQRRAREARERERQRVFFEHRNRMAKVAKIMLTADLLALQRGLNPYRDAAAFAALLESFNESAWCELIGRAGFETASIETRQAVIDGYYERAQGPHCAGLADMTFDRLQQLGGELATLIDGASERDRTESWWAYARATEREVHAEIALRAQKQAS